MALRTGDTLRLLNELAGAAREGRSRSEFRVQAMQLLPRVVGLDGAVWATIPPGPRASVFETTGWGFNPDDFRKVVTDPESLSDLERASANLERDEVSVDGGFTRAERQRSHFFCVGLRNLGVRSYASLALGHRAGRLCAIRLIRERGRFSADEVSSLRLLRNVLELGDLRFGPAPLRRARASLLAPRQRDIAELVQRGLTNLEIARVLGISPNTVRNQLAEAFRRVGVSRRAEFVAFLLGEPA